MPNNPASRAPSVTSNAKDVTSPVPATAAHRNVVPATTVNVPVARDLRDKVQADHGPPCHR